MPPRLSLRRAFLCVLCCGGVIILVSLHQKWPWPPTDQYLVPTPEVDLHPRVEVEDVKQDLEEEPAPATEAAKDISKFWFFDGGTQFPENARGTPKLFPDEAVGDRILDQLMYVPEDYQGNAHG